jgi:hypothetical protein
LFQFTEPSSSLICPRSRFGLLDSENASKERLHWTGKSCVEMRKLAEELDSDVVKDMVADEILRLTYIKLQEMEANLFGEHEDLGIPIEYMNFLNAEDDAPSICMVNDCNAMLARDHFDSPEEIPEKVRRILDTRPHMTKESQ